MTKENYKYRQNNRQEFLRSIMRATKLYTTLGHQPSTRSKKTEVFRLAISDEILKNVLINFVDVLEKVRILILKHQN